MDFHCTISGQILCAWMSATTIVCKTVERICRNIWLFLSKVNQGAKIKVKGFCGKIYLIICKAELQREMSEGSGERFIWLSACVQHPKPWMSLGCFPRSIYKVPAFPRVISRDPDQKWSSQDSEQVPKWNAGAAGGGLTHWTTKLAPQS